MPLEQFLRLFSDALAEIADNDKCQPASRVADCLGLDSVLCELNPEYVEIIKRRLAEPWFPRGESPPKKECVLPGQLSLFGD